MIFFAAELRITITLKRESEQQKIPLSSFFCLVAVDISKQRITGIVIIIIMHTHKVYSLSPGSYISCHVHSHPLSSSISCLNSFTTQDKLPLFPSRAAGNVSPCVLQRLQE